MPVQDPRKFRNALGQFATGVTVVTALDRSGNRVGMTANSFSSVSLDPMLVLWSVAKSCNAFDVFNHAEQFAIHVLHAGQQQVSNQFASKVPDRFAGIPCAEGIGGLPLLKDYGALFQCQTEHRYEGGDHIILVGRVLDFDLKPKPPLIFHAGRYADLPEVAEAC
ncbi:flavin reductase family protein [Microbulbifer taiwanensis]|uniref:Flavin reductase family protein n=2 Tax=Microbulbifer taiwanensis TaxID=986746 RepID=A0ABW1YNL0_9GAMM|nr:flavin reductase family protein [Microbulbifer taiwanensis]